MKTAPRRKRGLRMSSLVTKKAAAKKTQRSHRVAREQRCFSTVAQGRARVEKQLAKWERCCSLPDVDGKGENSWLGRLANGSLICIPCRDQLMSNQSPTCSLKSPLSTEEGLQIGKWTRLSDLRSHADSMQHGVAVVHHCKTQGIVLPSALASTQEDFKKVLHMVRSKSIKEQSWAGRKLRKMIWCLAEAYRRIKRTYLGKCAQLALHHDGSVAKLVLRFSLSDTFAKRSCGFLSVIALAEE